MAPTTAHIVYHPVGTRRLGAPDVPKAGITGRPGHIEREVQR
ncbi:hypothetical protein AB0D37_19210 [Streptomyces sp. NPDC048384]|jgi:hypothetical protein